MKKLLMSLSAICITSSTLSVVSCSFVNFQRQSIKNKVNNLIQVSSVLMRGTIIQNANQELAKGLVYDSNFLNDLVQNSKVKDILPNFKTDEQSYIKDLHDTYFGNQNLDRGAINQLSSNFLTGNVKSPVSPTDSFSEMFILLSSVLKSNGGIHPSLSGFIEALLPQLPLQDNLTKMVDSKKMEQVLNLLDKSSLPLSKFMAFGHESNGFYAVLKNFLNSEFVNAIKEKNRNEIEKEIGQFVNEIKLTGFGEILESFINSVLTIDVSDSNLTGQMILNASLNRISNFFARSSNQKSKIIDKSKLYESLSKNFDIDLGDVIAEFLDNLGISIDNFDFRKILNAIIGEPENIVDLVYFISGLLKYISSIDFSEFIPKDDKNLFSSTKDNNDYIAEINSKTLSVNPFKTKVFFNNFSTITNIKEDPNGKQMQKLFYLLFNSGKEATDIDSNISNIVSLIFKLSSNIDDGNKKYNYSSLLYGLGKATAIQQKWQVSGIGPDQVGNLFRWVIGDGLGHNSDFSGLNKVLDLLGNAGIKVDIRVSNNTTKKLKHLFNALWDEDSTLIKDLIGSQISLYSLLNTRVKIEGKDKTISEIIDFINRGIEGEVKQPGDKLREGISIVSNELRNENYKLWYKSNNDLVPFKEFSTNEDGSYNVLQVLIIASKRRGLILSLNKDKPSLESNIKGPKAVMNALGVDYDKNENQIFTKFREKSLLEGLEKIFDDEIISNTFDDLTKGFGAIKTINDEVIKNTYSKLIKDQNFKTELISKENIDDSNKVQKITYKVTYNDPFYKKEFSYEITLALKLDYDSWQISSIKKI